MGQPDSIRADEHRQILLDIKKKNHNNRIDLINSVS